MRTVQSTHPRTPAGLRAFARDGTPRAPPSVVTTRMLPVRRRRRVDERGGSRVELFVECPSHDTPRRTSACLSCGFGDEPHIDEASGETVVECFAAAADAFANTVLSRCDLDVTLVAADAPIAAAAKILLKSAGAHGGGGRDVAVVLGEGDAPIGILHRSSCLPAKHGARAVVRDAMEPVPILLSARDHVERAVLEVERAHVDLAVVVGWGGAVLGVARAADLRREPARRAAETA